MGSDLHISDGGAFEHLPGCSMPLRGSSNWPWVVASLCFLVPSAGQTNDVDQNYTNGKRALDNRRFEEAITLFDQALKKDPNHKLAHRCRAFASILAGDPQGAVRNFDVALRLNPADAVLYYGRGCAYHLLGKPALAIENLNEAIKRDPQYTAAYGARARVRLESGDTLGAFSDGTRNSGLLLRDRGFDGPARKIAQADLATGNAVDVTDFIIYHFWYLLFEEKRRANPAEAQPVDLSDDASRIANAQKIAGLDFATRREFDKAIARLNDAIRLAPKDWQAYRLRGAIYVVKGDLNSAVADVTRGIALNANEASLFRERSRIYLEMHESEKAVTDVEAARRIRKQKHREMWESLQKAKANKPSFP